MSVAEPNPAVIPTHLCCQSRWLQTTPIRAAEPKSLNTNPGVSLNPDGRNRQLVSLPNHTVQVGVDINAAAGNPWMAATLPFVAGLGPRKARALLQVFVLRLHVCRCKTSLFFPWTPCSRSLPALPALCYNFTRGNLLGACIAMRPCNDALKDPKCFPALCSIGSKRGMVRERTPNPKPHTLITCQIMHWTSPVVSLSHSTQHDSTLVLLPPSQSPTMLRPEPGTLLKSLQAVKRAGGAESRHALYRELGVLGEAVFINSAPFLRVRRTGVDVSNAQLQVGA